jgi:hypothetical protein
MTTGFSKIATLVLHAQYADSLSYYEDWLDAFGGSQELNVTTVNICPKGSLKTVEKTIRDYDLIVLLHSTNADTLEFVKPLENVLERRKGKLLAFIGNELNYPPPLVGMRDKIAFLRKIRPEFIATQLLVESARKLYEDVPGATVKFITHALNPKRFRPVVPQSERQMDIGVRSSRYHPFLGDDERVSILEYFVQNRFEPPLALDVSTDYAKRLGSDGWANFLNQCRGTLATEAGSYFLENDDATVTKAAEYIKSRAGKMQRLSVGLSSRKYKRLVPQFLKPGIKLFVKTFAPKKKFFSDVFYSVSSAEINELFFKNYANPLSGKCVSSRHFDAIGTGTCQIMFPGRFNGIFEVDRHYIALSRDFSNVQDVLRRFRDFGYRQKMVEETYEYVISCHTYRHRIAQIVGLVG